MKKGIFIISLLLFVIGINNSCYAAPKHVNTTTMKSILEELEITKTDENIEAMVEKFNAWIDYQTQDLAKDFDLGNILFYKSNGEANILKFLIVNMGRGSEELEHLYIDTTYIAAYYSNNIWSSWKKNTVTGAITGVNTDGYFNVWYCIESQVNMLGGNHINHQDYGRMKGGYTNNNSALYLNYAVAYPGALIFAKTPSYGYSTYSLTHTYDVSTIMPTPTPTPTATPTPTPSGGGSTSGGTDLTPVIGKLDETNKNLEEIKNNIPTSGDIEKATEEGTVKGNETYWGNSGDVNNYDSEKEVKDIIDNTISSVSGEMSKIEAIKILEDAENQFWNRFKISGNPRNRGIWLKTKLGWYKIPRSSFNRKTAK